MTRKFAQVDHFYNPKKINDFTTSDQFKTALQSHHKLFAVCITVYELPKNLRCRMVKLPSPSVVTFLSANWRPVNVTVSSLHPILSLV